MEPAAKPPAHPDEMRAAPPHAAIAAPPQQALAEHVRAEYQPIAAHSAEGGPEHWERKTCRACLADGLVEVLNLGDMPPANALVRPAELSRPEPRFPLSVRLCERCGMVQLGHVVPPELLFRSYLFFTSTSRHMSEHFAELMAEASEQFVKPDGLIVEIGSNDGTALASIRRRDIRRLGIDPARNIAVMAAARGVPTVSEFFSETLAREVARVAGPAQLIVACNVLGHIDDLDDVCRGIKALLAPDGALVVEVPYLADLVERAEYDTVYHEHLSYFAIRPLALLFNRHGLRIQRVQFFPVHGGAMRVTAVPSTAASETPGRDVSHDVQSLIDREISSGLASREVHLAMARKVEAERAALRKTLLELKTEGKKTIGYGAPAKATVVLNYCNLTPDLLPAVIDSTPAKQGFHIPGTHQPILTPAALADQKPDMLLLLAWNHAREIAHRESAFLARGGKFLLPHGGWIE